MQGACIEQLVMELVVHANVVVLDVVAHNPMMAVVTHERDPHALLLLYSSKASTKTQGPLQPPRKQLSCGLQTGKYSSKVSTTSYSHRDT